ncbi:putative peptidoglycan lipid II flippase [Marchantia polymorpha subsp. ruderalis]|uniref:Lipid II flippase MurJ n=1 Tax=Marchantia polymorpha TaxID=3197 RepID=A0A2R6WPE0_MARPO|nr:hypothetical protein MARPO_0069s0065 [Marchantia polymorpha]BBN03522.1 hypothetical protein Mp_2g24160 [Marchantia polymorpha subsp. ruderalis]|eukprot:PTQ35728.1 hypothetical protein MARPO_0069s0065 [Marchantia polymorpha]
MAFTTCLVAPRSLPCNLQKECTQRSLWGFNRKFSLISTRIYALRSDSRKKSTLQYTLSFRDSVDLHKQHRIFRSASAEVQCSGDSGFEPTIDSNKTRTGSWGLLRTGALIGSATVLSKILGLARETVLAAIYGVGPVMNAYSYASVVPGFFLALLGGINGPFHSAVAASLSKRSREEGRDLIQGVTAVTFVVGVALSLAVVFCAAPLLDVLAPGLVVSGSPGNVTRHLAILQLKIMAPCAVLAALIGIGFGSLSTVGVYGLPSLSPALSSISIMSAVALSTLMLKRRSSMSNLYSGSVALAAGTTFGALAQWVLQAVALRRTGYGPTQVLGRPKAIFEDKGVREVFSVLLPAAVSSGLLQIATFTDLYFASFIPGAAAGLNYANLLVQAPLGILSSAILVPMLPMFSRLSKPSGKLELQERVKQGLLLSMVLTFLMTAMLVSLAEPVVRIVFQRRAFDASASKLVSSLLICYSLGCTFSLARDLLVRVFYSLGDSRIPFQISAAAISANVLLDWIAVRRLGLGVQGLVLATSFVNGASAVALLLLLSSNLDGLKLRHWVQPLSILGFSATLAGIVAKVSYNELLVKLVANLHAASERSLWLADVISVILAGGIGVISYFLPLIIFRIPEMEDVLKLLKAKL